MVRTVHAGFTHAPLQPGRGIPPVARRQPLLGLPARLDAAQLVLRLRALPGAARPVRSAGGPDRRRAGVAQPVAVAQRLVHLAEDARRLLPAARPALLPAVPPAA